MKNVLILHGTDNNHTGNWFPWLKRELELQGYVVWCPDLPGADHPDQNTYLNVLFGNPDWHFNDESIVVGHSSGGVTALKLVQHLPEGVIIHKCIVVGASYTVHGADPIGGLFKEPYDFDKIKKHAKTFIVFQSDNDPHVPLEDGKLFARALDGEGIFPAGQGHFNLEMGEKYRQFPAILEKILE